MGEKQKRLVILDTHAILHRGFHAMPDFASSKGEPTGALYGLVSMLLRIVSELKPDYIVAAFDLPGGTFRHEVYEDYKATRVKTDDALVAQIIRSREVLDAFGIPCYDTQGFEADDVIGTVAEELKKTTHIDLIIASGDMDTLQLVDDNRVRVYTLKKGLSDTILYNEDAVRGRFGFGPELIPDYKGLRGDPSDNIKGVKGIGEKTAEILISEFGSLEDIYKVLKKSPEKLKAAGVKDGMIEKLRAGEEDAEFSKMLATIRRDAPIKFEVPKEEWHPSLSKQKILDMLAKFEFRSLIPRVNTLLNGTSPALAPKKSSDLPSAAEPAAGQTFSPQELASRDGSLFAETEKIDPEEFNPIALATSVLDSNIPKPTLEDVLRQGKAATFAEAKKNILAEIKEKNLEFIYSEVELKLTPVLRAMEKRGVKIDKEFLKGLSKEYHIELDKIAARIYEAAGGEFNINSPKQLGEVLFDKLGLTVKNQKKTAGGARSTRESELEKMKELHPIVGDILSHRELAKLLGTYIDALPNELDAAGRVHTTFIQIGAATGRLATQNPGLQNIPIKTELGRAIRKAFIPGEGMQLVSFDYSQIELRIAAFLSHDPGLTEIFMDGRDVHTEVAARVFHVKAEDVSYDQRRAAKVINFGILYGMGVNSLRASLGTGRAEAQEFFDQYFAAFPRLAAYLDEIKGVANRQGYTETFFGRRRYFDGIKSPIPYVRASAERMAINAPMQGTQADIVKLAMVQIEAFIKNEGYEDSVRLLLQVHDELVFEIDPKKIPTVAPKIKEIMENIISDKERRGIPFLAEGKVGPNWGEMKPT